MADSLQKIGAWAFAGAWLAEHLTIDAQPTYDEDTDAPLDQAARLESQLSLLLEEYLQPAERELDRLRSVLRAEWQQDPTSDGGKTSDDVRGEWTPSRGFSMPLASPEQVERLRRALPRGSAWSIDATHAIAMLDLEVQSVASAAAFAAFAEAIGADEGVKVLTVATKTLVVVCVVARASSEDALRRCLRMVSAPGLDPTESGS